MKQSTKHLKTALGSILTIIAVVIFCAACFFAYAFVRVNSARSQSVEVTVDGNAKYKLTVSGFGATNTLSLIKRFILRQPLYDNQTLHSSIADLAKEIDNPAQNYNIFFKDKTVEINMESSAGSILDQNLAFQKISDTYNQHLAAVILQTTVDQPTVTVEGVQKAAEQAKNILSANLDLHFQTQNISVPTETIGNWIVTSAAGQSLNISFDKNKISADLNTALATLNTQPKEMAFEVQNDQITNFTAAVDGVKINLDSAVTDTVSLLEARKNNLSDEQPVVLQGTVVKPNVPDQAKEMGIEDIIGTATTTFTGSPKGRIANIGVGAKKINNILIAPGDEFSTIKTLGEVNAASGYVPELSIIGNKTVPEYGGGLCQIATTLFRSVLNTGLPVTARQNHSYRVSYYEKDGNGKYIGPGLDATIYEPAPDFKFINDTGHWLLLTSAIDGVRLTFTFYGTLDGRKVSIDGPHKLTEVPSGPVIYEETDKLALGTTKKVETAHPGGTAIATYTVSYTDGTTKKQVFKSSYRPWPERILVGTGTTTSVNPNQLAAQD